MKAIYITLILLLSSVMLCCAQQSFNNPIAIGPVLLNETSLDQMTELCKWYRLTEQPSDNNMHVYQAEDGTLIKFNMTEDNSPYVEVHTTQSKKAIEKIITSLGYQKYGDKYIKGSIYANRYKTAQILGKKEKLVIFSTHKTSPITR